MGRKSGGGVKGAPVSSSIHPTERPLMSGSTSVCPLPVRHACTMDAAELAAEALVVADALGTAGFAKRHAGLARKAAPANASEAALCQGPLSAEQLPLASVLGETADSTFATGWK